MLVALFWISNAQAALEISADTINVRNGVITVEVDTTNGNPPDSAMRYYYLFVGTANPPTSKVDSIKSAHTFPDTLYISGLLQNTEYYFCRIRNIIGGWSVRIRLQPILRRLIRLPRWR
jgi:hypothetical protein